MHHKLQTRIKPEPEVFLSMGLLEPFRYKGIMPIALELLCEQLKYPGYCTIGASVVKDNVSSKKCLTKCGFIEVKCFEQSRIYCKYLAHTSAEMM
jgi:RimJ/RimL family protein N-acetyltransferase